MATQKGRNWSSGDIVTAANLSSIERGVSAVAEEYTPTTWANGNTVTAAALNNIEQGIVNAGGGGGSSDFSTAEVTIVNGSYENLRGAFIYNDKSGYTNENDETATLILYKGEGYLTDDGMAFIDSVDGNITFDSEYRMYIVTGNCTITMESGGAV